MEKTKYLDEKIEVVTRIEPQTFPWQPSVEPIEPRIQVIKILFILDLHQISLLERERRS
jgi:hypothetical protein